MMLTTLRAIAAVLLSFGLLFIGNGLFNTLLGIRMRLEGFSTQVTGLIMSGYFAGLLLSAFFATHVISRVGHIRAFAVFASIISASALFHILYIDPYFWASIRLISGFCIGGIIIIIESWLNEMSDNRVRGQVFSFYMITTYAASGSGQLILPLADPKGFILFSVISILFSFALIPVLMTRSPAPRQLPAARMNVVELYRTSPLALAGAFMAAMTNSSFYSMGPVFTHDIGFTLQQTAYFMSAAVLGGLLLQWPVGKLSDRFDRRWVLTTIAFLASIVSFVIFLFSGRQPEVIIRMAVCYGSLAFLMYSLSAAHANDFTPRDKMVQTASSLLVTYGLGAIIGPVLSSFIMGIFGSDKLFLWQAVLSLALCAYAIYRSRQRKSVLPQNKADFVAVAANHSASKQMLFSETQNSTDTNEGKLRNN